VSTRPLEHKEGALVPTTEPTPSRRRQWQPLVSQEIALRIREAREREGLTRTQLAHRLGRGMGAVSGWEAGHGVGLAALVQLAQVLPGFEQDLHEVIGHYANE